LNKILKKNNADYSTELTKEFDENGIMLSGGEVQKIGIARLLTGGFGLLLLDEPSSSLDPVAEYKMAKLIFDSSNRATTIMVAHRLSTIRNADKIILVDGGAIKETGTHNELMSLKGKYYEMFSKQAENYMA
ncbi:MAG: ATP-binding cassette domain-containing protein, partial [Treponema sp.]|nr:ATP-binding cassette domain-containing protein [Treponema sp.]